MIIVTLIDFLGHHLHPYMHTYIHISNYKLDIHIFVNKYSDRSIDVKLPTLLGNYDRQTDLTTNRNQPTDRPTDGLIGS